MLTNDPRETILRSIRMHLAASAPHDAREPILVFPRIAEQSPSQKAVASVVEVFEQNLEAVGGHCILARDQTEVDDAITRITGGRRIGASSSALARDDRFKQLSKKDLFEVEVGITQAQAGIAETGTLVLDSSVERNRQSLVPPVHIAILDASRIYMTLGETLAALRSGEEVSPAITFITGPSRTADIELTLAIGVHGPQELYVIVNQFTTVNQATS